MAVSAQAVPSRRGVSALAIAGAAAVICVPLGVLLWLLRIPPTPADPATSFEHLVIVANVSLLALLVAVLVARAALLQKAYRVLFLALGFASMAGFFAVHGLATPGVILPTNGLTFAGGTYHEQHGAASILGISAYLSVLVPALFFSVRYLPLNWQSRQELLMPSRVLAGLVAVALVLYGCLSLRLTELVALLPIDNPPFAFIAAGGSVVLLLFAAWRQSVEYRGSRMPMQAAQVVSFLLLADAQVAMVIAPVWSLAWWEYHVIMLAAVAAALWALFIELDRRRGFERFVSPAVVERIMSGDSIQLGGERRTVTIMFADLRNSTQLAEKLPAEAVVGLLNSYVGTMAQCVFDHGGILDKYLGDGLMAIFGVLPEPTQGVAAAAKTVEAIRQSVAALNEDRAERGEREIKFGTGIHTGEVVLGAVGAPQRSDYTAIGDTVNTASRLESLCKEYHVDCVLSADAAALLTTANGYAVKPLGTAAIRGKEQPLQVFTLT
jgi:class 3 adenylate cyclase